LHELAKRIGARTVAEWVENAQCANLLAHWGVDYLQGAYFGMPLDLLPVDIMPVDLRHDLEAGRQ
jgi:EAL domain-containing protein (putative c-di-GMP-specific phosphodiesterase class I)